MASCETQLWALIQEIEPTQQQKEGAAASHRHLREVLNQGTFSQRWTDSFLSGSYARDTAIRPIDDVDVVFVIKPETFATASSTLLTGGFPTPDRVLDSFANAIRYRYPVSSIFGQRRSVRLQLYHLDIDVVPAVPADNANRVLWIADSTTGQWIKAAPRAQAEVATTINQKTGARFKPLVKVLKYWNSKLPQTATIKSFAVETLATWMFDRWALPTIQDGLYQALDFIAFCGGTANPHFQWGDSRGISLRWLSVALPDAAGTGTNVLAGLEEERRLRFVQAAVRSRDKMFEAKQATHTDTALNRVREALHA